MKLGSGPQTCAAIVAKAKDNEAYQNRFLPHPLCSTLYIQYHQGNNWL
jgi:hypothetical protein